MKKSFPCKLFSHQNIAFFFMLIGIFARGFMLGSVPGGVNMDEAFGAYEGYSLLHYGVDSWGYPFPVYLETWGSGMSALNSYLMIPFLALFDTHIWVVRLPQFVASCLTLPVVYKLLCRMVNRDAALIGLLYFAVCPWSVMYARYGLDCNLAPAFLLFGFYFFILGVENSKCYLLSALFYGLSLYCYATIWPIVPVLLILMAGYLLYTKKLRFDIYTLLSVCLLGVLALPLILFLLVNNGYLPEIVTPFLSIPRLNSMRGSEISSSAMLWKLKQNLLMLLKQNDGLYWNATEEFGLYYKGFLIFAVIGGCFCLKRSFTSVCKRRYDSVSMLIFPFLCGILLCALISANFNRMNCIHIPMSIFIALGLYLTGNFLRKYFRPAGIAVYIMLIVCFVCFERYYFTSFRENIGEEFQEGLGESVEYAMELADGADIYVEEGFIYSKILFYSRIPAPKYRSTVQYRDSRVSSFGQFVVEPEAFPESGVCIILPESIDAFQTSGWTVTRFGHSAVAYK